MKMLVSWCPGSVCDPCKPKPPAVDCTPHWPTGSTVYQTAPDGMSGGSTWTFATGLIAQFAQPLCSSPHCVWNFNTWSNPFGSYPTGVSFAWPRWIGGLPGGTPQPNAIQASITIDGFSAAGLVTGRPFSDTDNAYHGLLPAASFTVASIPNQMVAVVQYSGALGITLGPEGVGYVTVYA